MPIQQAIQWQISVKAMSPGAIDMVKVIALTAMLLDHLNILFLHPPLPELYALGRMVFPMFVIIWALNLSHNPASLQARANRLWIWALIAQAPFWLAFRHLHPWYALNILFVFAGVTQLVALSHRYGVRGGLGGLIILAALACPLVPASYGSAGLVFAAALVVLFSPVSQKRCIRLTAIITAAGALFSLNGITHLTERPLDTLIIAILPTLILPFVGIWLAIQLKPAGSRRFMPSRFFYHAYAGHLLLLALCRIILN